MPRLVRKPQGVEYQSVQFGSGFGALNLDPPMEGGSERYKYLFSALAGN